MHPETNFFGDAPLLSWLPDETLFSLVSRHHKFWGHGLAKQTNLLLFGRSRGGSQHDLPSGIDDFVRLTEQRLGTADEICVQHTLLRYYRNFIGDRDEENFVATLRSQSVANLKFRLGILTSRFRAHHPLKACSVCMQNDRGEFGWAYWHIQHQYPGVWICQTHGSPLLESDLKSSGVERFHWHLPGAAHLRPWPVELKALRDMHFDSLSRLANLTINIVHRQPRIRIDLTQLHWAYRVALGRRNLLTPNGGLRLSAIADEFLTYVQTLKLLPEFSGLASTINEANAQMSRMLRVPRSGTHPLRHIVMIDWLFGESGKFFKAYEKILSLPQISNDIKPSGQSLILPSTAEKSDRKQTLAKLIQEEGKSMRAAAAVLDIDTATAIVWAAQMGIEASHRPKKLKADRRKALVEILRQGVDKKIAAKEFEISVVTVTHVLRSEFGLNQQWQQARQAAARVRAREAWSALVTEHANLGVKFIRNLNPAAYAWLYRNDRKWLSERSPVLGVSISSTSHRVHWDERDLDLSAAVERAALTLRSSLGKQKLMLWHLYQAIPELKAKLSVLDRLPITLRAIEVALGRRVPATLKTDMLD